MKGILMSARTFGGVLLFFVFISTVIIGEVLPMIAAKVLTAYDTKVHYSGDVSTGCMYLQYTKNKEVYFHESGCFLSKKTLVALPGIEHYSLPVSPLRLKLST